MQVTAFKGIVENGAVRLCENATLPENTRVYVIVAEPSGVSPASTPRIRTPHLADSNEAADFRKQVIEIPGNAKI